MIITLWWKAWSWKGTVSKIIAEKLNYEIISIWSLKRKLAEEMGLSILEFNRLWEKPENQEKFDLKYEEYQKNLNTNDNILLESRLWFLCQPNAFKVFLDVSDEIASKRILGDNRTTDKFSSQQETLKAVKERNESDQKRYLDLYWVDLRDKSHYDLIIDTSEKTPQQVAKEIINWLEKYNK
jgi:predicted cytidylate kinase